MSLNTILATTPLVSTGYHLKATGTTIGNSLIWDNGTNVGIGNTNTSYTLDVSGSLRNTTSAYFATTSGGVGMGTTNTTYATLNVKASSTQLYNGIAIYSTNGTESFFGIGNSGSVVGFDATYGASGAYLPIAFNVGGSERLRITTSGNVGIGTSSPNGLLQLGNLQSGGQGSINGASGTINRAIINCPYPGASALTLGYYSAAYGLDIWVNGDGTGLAPVYIDQRQNEAIIFRRSTQGTAVESMRIQSGGNLLVGTTTDNGGRICATGANSSSANDSIYLENAALTVCFRVRNDGVIFTGTAARSPVNDLSGAAANLIVAAGGNLQKSTASSIRFKENVIDWIGDGLNTILALKPKTFTYKKDYYSNPQRQFLGLIAEDVAEVSTYLADFENEDGTGQVENVRYANIVVPLVKAIQEMNTKLDEQNQTIQSLQEQINILAK